MFLEEKLPNRKKQATAAKETNFIDIIYITINISGRI
jgi:hypothetical protein